MQPATAGRGVRSAVGVALIAAGVFVGAHTLAQWASEGAPPAAVIAAAAPRPARDVPSRGAAVLQKGETDPGPERRPMATAGVAAVAYLPAPPAVPAVTPDQQRLTRDLQRALRRAHCYDGPVNGRWTPATKGAMSAFTARANATLPVDTPDIVLLALLESDQGARCGSCPEGQQLGAHGSCVPAAIVAQAARRAPAEGPPTLRAPRPPAPPVARGAIAARKVPPIAGRMGIGGPNVAVAEAQRAYAAGPSATPGGPQILTPARERQAARHHARRRAVRPTRFAYRPVRYRGLAGLLFGGWPF
jgi:hypothetical protein